VDDRKHGNIKKLKKKKKKKKTGLNVLALCKKLEIVKGITIKTPIFLIWLLPFALITNPISSFSALFALAIDHRDRYLDILRKPVRVFSSCKYKATLPMV
jgi:hypothetical protein